MADCLYFTPFFNKDYSCMLYHGGQSTYQLLPNLQNTCLFTPQVNYVFFTCGFKRINLVSCRSSTTRTWMATHHLTAQNPTRSSTTFSQRTCTVRPTTLCWWVCFQTPNTSPGYRSSTVPGMVLKENGDARRRQICVCFVFSLWLVRYKVFEWVLFIIYMKLGEIL